MTQKERIQQATALGREWLETHGYREDRSVITKRHAEILAEMHRLLADSLQVGRGGLDGAVKHNNAVQDAWLKAKSPVKETKTFGGR